MCSLGLMPERSELLVCLAREAAIGKTHGSPPPWPELQSKTVPEKVPETVPPVVVSGKLSPKFSHQFATIGSLDLQL